MPVMGKAYKISPVSSPGHVQSKRDSSPTGNARTRSDEVQLDDPEMLNAFRDFTALRAEQRRSRLEQSKCFMAAMRLHQSVHYTAIIFSIHAVAPARGSH